MHEPGLIAELGGLALELTLIVGACVAIEELRRWARWRRFGRYLARMRTAR